MGLSVLDSGHLDAPYAGHDIGTPYVVVFADCLDVRESAEFRLGDIARITDMAWAYDWEPVRHQSCQGSAITIFPEPQREPTRS